LGSVDHNTVTFHGNECKNRGTHRLEISLVLLPRKNNVRMGEAFGFPLLISVRPIYQ
jgi:hypothetical protein